MKPKIKSKGPIDVKTSLNFETKKTSRKTVDFNRAKSFCDPKIELKTSNKNRPFSASHNLDRPVSRINYGKFKKILFLYLTIFLNSEFGENFTEYDSDDGRSSRLCQNEDDNKYFGQLIDEFKSSVITQITDLDEDKYINYSELTDSLNNSVDNLELTIRNDDFDYEIDELESLTMEELKSLN